ncbi:MAG TPA: hypothetical protein ENG70_04400 [Candidatus Cloacimonetes bacterium]|nr:hypothetical protein [Candidatus Cloacimonadota bacterium]HEX38084.1 hypothetical protein [Candidatus Cloacimonadota bacterium]
MKNKITWKLDVLSWLLVIVFLSLVLAIIYTPYLYAQQTNLKFTTEPSEYVLYNTNNQKMYLYYRVNTGEKLVFTITGVDSLEIFSRIFYNEDAESMRYIYVVEQPGKIDTLYKKCRKSSETRAVDGQFMSTYNKSVFYLDETTSISIKNIADVPIAFKLDYNAPNNYSSQVDYIAYSPDEYLDEKIIIVNDKEYTYYKPIDGFISLDLQGPVFLKIISRTIFESAAIQKMDYQFSVYDNNSLKATFTEVAYKSTESIFLNDIEKIPSTGDVNILQFDKGNHHIHIRDNTNNHSVIFRLYINKKAVHVGDR